MRCPHCNKPIIKTAISVEYNGEMMSLRDLSRATGIAYTTLQNRYDGGLRGQELIGPRGARRSGERPKDPPTDTSALMRQFLSGRAS